MYQSNDTRPILPVCFCIHRNVTMGSRKKVNGEIKTRLAQITEGLRGFVDAGLRPDAPCIPDLALLLFAGSSHLFREFRIPAHSEEIPQLCDDTTPDCCLGEAVNNALDAIESRVSLYRARGITFLQPLLIVVSSGRENDGPQEVLERASMRCREKILRGELTAVLFGTTVNTSLELLRAVAPGGIVKSVEMADLPAVLTAVWQYARLETASTGSGNSHEVPRSGEHTGSAAPYILGIFTDVERRKE